MYMYTCVISLGLLNMHVWKNSQNLSTFSTVIAVLTFLKKGKKLSLSLSERVYPKKFSKSLNTIFVMTFWYKGWRTLRTLPKLNHPSCPNCFWTVSIHINFGESVLACWPAGSSQLLGVGRSVPSVWKRLLASGGSRKCSPGHSKSRDGTRTVEVVWRVWDAQCSHGL